MDTSTFLIERQNLRDRMEAERVILAGGSNGSKPSLWHALFSLGMKWGVFPMVQEWALLNVGRWVSDKIRRRT